MTVRLLVSGDIHIGRRPTKVDASDASEWSCARMWSSIVARAIDESVDAVLLSGDVVDQENRFFEATGPLENGIRLLSERRIPTIAVSGNHDFDVLHRLADTIGSDQFHLLGRGGEWESMTLSRDSQPRVEIHGWSFPEKRVPYSPLREYRLTERSDIATLGLLHADLNAVDSRYAPTTLAELRNTSVDMWVLGHVHTPHLYRATGQSSVLYPGSPQAMDPGESGPHGPWLIEIEGPNSIEARMIPLSRVQYDDLEIEFTSDQTQGEIEASIVHEVSQAVQTAADANAHLQRLSLRLRLIGKTDLSAELDHIALQVSEDLNVYDNENRCAARVERVANETRPDIDLREWARRNDPPGQLAQLLIALQTEDRSATSDELSRIAHQAMLSCYDSPVFAGIAAAERPEPAQARELLIRQGLRMMEALRAQKAPA